MVRMGRMFRMGVFHPVNLFYPGYPGSDNHLGSDGFLIFIIKYPLELQPWCSEIY